MNDAKEILRLLAISIFLVGMIFIVGEKQIYGISESTINFFMCCVAMMILSRMKKKTQTINTTSNIRYNTEKGEKENAKN